MKLHDLGPTAKSDEPDFELTSESLLYSGFRRMTLYKYRHRLFSGGMGRELEREVMSEGKTSYGVVVMPYDPLSRKIVMVEQFRITAALTKVSRGWLLEPVAGMVDAGETPEQAAFRETVEECGAPALRLTKAADYLSSPGNFAQVMHLYFAQIDLSAIASHAGLLSEGEDIRTRVLDEAEAYELADAGVFHDCNTLVALGWLARHGEKLRRDWLGA